MMCRCLANSHMKIDEYQQLMMAASYVPLYDMLCEIVTAIKDDPEASREMKALARRGRKTLNEAKARLANDQ